MADIHTVGGVRAAFWQDHPQAACRRDRRGRPMRQNQQPTDTRAAWCDYVDSLARDGRITAALAQRVTL